ncbi:hypothetical protein HYC85_007936 [Camellia sinensis]|uniref:Uncharacterized protein n=1 Tax=Camellia sinensis TaxID=4442 RepID=A0A7J7HQD1_CAMSI|nr:hypothetical protein HYC85_007936 [Camellia sinensis]
MLPNRMPPTGNTPIPAAVKPIHQQLQLMYASIGHIIFHPTTPNILHPRNSAFVCRQIECPQNKMPSIEDINPNASQSPNQNATNQQNSRTVSSHRKI